MGNVVFQQLHGIPAVFYLADALVQFAARLAGVGKHQRQPGDQCHADSEADQ
ncbi:hypothetical protein D3C79_1106700 [compost metagenome]